MPAAVDLSLLRNMAIFKRIAAITAVGGILGLAYGIVAPKWYRSVVTVVPATPQKPSVSGMLGGELGALAPALAASALGGSADANRIAAVLQSVAVTDAVIAKFDLRARYREEYQETTREVLWKHCEVKTLPKPNLVQLSCEDKDPRFVQQMLAFFAEHGNQVFRRVSVSSASEEVRFLEKHVAELRQESDNAAARMRNFQEQHKIVDLDSQAKAVVSALAALNSQRITKQLEMDYARTFSARDEATMQQLRSQLSVVDEKVHDLEMPMPPVQSSAQAQDSNKGRGNMFPAALAVPKLRAEFETLYRDRKVAEATLVFALERLEGAKANEARDASTFLVLDPPALPTRKSRPKTVVVVAIMALIGLLVSVTFEWSRTVGGIGGMARAALSQSRSGKTRHVASSRGEDPARDELDTEHP